jgi:hypothetical protein
MTRESLFTIGRCQLSLYAIGAGTSTRSWPWGRADLGNAVFAGADALVLSIKDRMEDMPFMPSGSRYPQVIQRPGGVSIEFGRILLAEDDNGTTKLLSIRSAGKYVMDVVLGEENPLVAAGSRVWIARTYYGVRFSSDTIEAAQSGQFFTQNTVVNADLFAERTGTGVPTLPVS